MKEWVCIEDDERFVIKAKTLTEAKEDAQMWGASVIREVTEEEKEAGVLSDVV